MKKEFYPTIFKYLLIPTSGFDRSKKERGDLSSINKEICFKQLFIKKGKEIINIR